MSSEEHHRIGYLGACGYKFGLSVEAHPERGIQNKRGELSATHSVAKVIARDYAIGRFEADPRMPFAPEGVACSFTVPPFVQAEGMPVFER